MADIEERGVRIQKMNAARQCGMNPYPSDAHRTHTCLEAIQQFEQLVSQAMPISLVGRIRGIRRHGGSSFFVLEDASGSIQLFLKKDLLGEEQYSHTKEMLDMGDFLEVAGTMFETKTGEKTVQVSGFRLLTKALLPLPEQWHGLTDVETRFRQRYLDLIANKEVREIFASRARIIKTMRNFFEGHGFLEVETPVLQAIPGGATARPFITHHNALDADLYLRIAPELFLKRLVVGGFERVFEFARCFRNEGIDFSHNPEFTMLEAYMAYADYRDLMDLVERLMCEIVIATHGSETMSINGVDVVFKPPFRRIPFASAIQERSGINIFDYHDHVTLLAAMKKHNVSLEKTEKIHSWAQLVDVLFKKTVASQITEPTFIIDHPRVLSPLSKRKADSDHPVVERFQLILGGVEIVNAFSELNDPLDQRERFAEQQKAKLAGDEEAHPFDDDFVTALEYGMPPTAGLGIGIDRLVSLLTGRHAIKEVILFPTLRPKTQHSDAQSPVTKDINADL